MFLVIFGLRLNLTAIIWIVSSQSLLVYELELSPTHQRRGELLTTCDNTLKRAPKYRF